MFSRARKAEFITTNNQQQTRSKPKVNQQQTKGESKVSQKQTTGNSLSLLDAQNQPRKRDGSRQREEERILQLKATQPEASEVSSRGPRHTSTMGSGEEKT